MIPQLPAFIPICFILVVLTTLGFLLRASSSKWVLPICLGWLAIQGLLAYAGFYRNTTAMPPHILLAVFPALIFIIILLVAPAGKKFIRGLSLKMLLLMSVVRIPIELILYELFLHKAVPELITFAGSNYDMLSGI